MVSWEEGSGGVSVIALILVVLARDVVEDEQSSERELSTWVWDRLMLRAYISFY